MLSTLLVVLLCSAPVPCEKRSQQGYLICSETSNNEKYCKSRVWSIFNMKVELNSALFIFMIESCEKLAQAYCNYPAVQQGTILRKEMNFSCSVIPYILVKLAECNRASTWAQFGTNGTTVTSLLDRSRL